MGIFRGVVASLFAGWVAHVAFARLAGAAKNQSMKMLPRHGVGVASKQSCGISCGVKVCKVGRFLREHDESRGVSGCNMLVGPRWREFQCLAAPRCVL